MIMRSRFFSLLAFAALVPFSGQHAQAALITGVTATATTDFVNTSYAPGNRRAAFVVDNSGLAAGAHTEAPEGTMWMTMGDSTSVYFTANSPPADPDPEIVFNLGGLYQLANTQIWNYNEGTPWFKRGVQQMQILTKANAADPYVPLGGPTTLAIAPGVASYTGQNVSLGNVVARFVKFDILSNYDGATYPRNAGSSPGATDYAIVGLSEVQFNGVAVPEPSTALLAVVGSAIGLLGLRWARRKTG